MTSVEPTDEELLTITFTMRVDLGTPFPLHRLEGMLKGMGYKLGRQKLLKLIWGLEPTGLIRVSNGARGYQISRYSETERAAWSEADQLAKVLGGTAIHRVNEDNPAQITLTLKQAREFVRRWRESLGHP